MQCFQVSSFTFDFMNYPEKWLYSYAHTRKRSCAPPTDPSDRSLRPISDQCSVEVGHLGEQPITILFPWPALKGAAPHHEFDLRSPKYPDARQ